MEPDALPPPEDLWWSWACVAALALLADDAGHDEHVLDLPALVLRLDRADGSWLRMQPTRGGRWVLWGRSADAPTAPPDARRGAPDWTLSEATDEGRPTFVCWWAHEEWDTSTSVEDPGAVPLLRALLGADPELCEAARSGRVTDADLRRHAPADVDDLRVLQALDLLADARTPPPLLPRGPVRERLRDQLHRQMREAPDRERALIQQPPAVVRWAQVSGPTSPFEYAVMARRDRLVPAPTNTRLPAAAERTLVTLLHVLHHDEASAQSGAWLFARVASDGVVVEFERAFDSYPSWWRVLHPEQGPALDDLAWEMGQRHPDWRPAWASLLPARLLAQTPRGPRAGAGPRPTS
ncbi:hypothetical protein [Marmoricola sp. Leaf446]|uniref:hypothetical protein n=1 Tax=Marmoricola sp. Leaf446 TaxID=1736379 RepID=UPI0012E3C3A5|nr:hypothetical protein [Marmoricola sp. Leaf446]